MAKRRWARTGVSVGITLHALNLHSQGRDGVRNLLERLTSSGHSPLLAITKGLGRVSPIDGVSTVMGSSHELLKLLLDSIHCQQFLAQRIDLMCAGVNAWQNSKQKPVCLNWQRWLGAG